MLRSNVRLSAQEFADLRNQVKAVRESGVPRLMYVAPPKQVFTCTWADGFYMLYDASGNQVMRSLMPQDVIGFLRTRPGINTLGFELPAMPEATVQAMSISKSKSKSPTPTPAPAMHVVTPMPTVPTVPSVTRTVPSVTRTVPSVRKPNRKPRPASKAATTRASRAAATVTTVAPKTHRRKGVPQQAPAV